MADEDQIGTTLERRHRRQYWLIMGGGLLVSLVIGWAMGASTGPEGTIPAGLAILFVAALALLLGAGTWIYFRKVDELEWANNLFASFWGFNAFILAFPAWLILWKGRLVPEPDMFTIYIGAALVALAAYLWKRYR
jgi:FtsH-binding integral membrane protein